MKKASLIILSFLFINISLLSQSNDTSSCNPKNSKYDSTIIAYIKGKKGKQHIKWKFFYNKFELKLSDPSYEIIRFRMTWDLMRKSSVVTKVIHGNIIIPEETAKEGYSLKNIGPGDMIVFEEIIIKKGDKCLRTNPFVVITILK